jgi:acetyltransferase-like isoleucine patch superfamily enzyme
LVFSFLRKEGGVIHPLSDCKNSNIPESTNVWQYCIIFPKCKIGSNCNICSHCLIENEVKIGNNVTIKCGVQVWDGITIEDDVFIGANVTFTNDKYPKSKNSEWQLLTTVIKRGASIGAGSTILPGLTIGENAVVGAGSVVTKDVPAREIWVGNPAQYIKKVDELKQ